VIPEQWNAVLRRVIKSVVVGPDAVVIAPRRGEPTGYDRKLITPKRPKRERETPHGPDGKFIRRG